MILGIKAVEANAAEMDREVYFRAALRLPPRMPRSPSLLSIHYVDKPSLAIPERRNLDAKRGTAGCEFTGMNTKDALEPNGQHHDRAGMVSED
jgi:hypothetical protein